MLTRRTEFIPAVAQVCTNRAGRKEPKGELVATKASPLRLLCSALSSLTYCSDTLWGKADSKRRKVLLPNPALGELMPLHYQENAKMRETGEWVTGDGRTGEWGQIFLDLTPTNP